jgi:hypothetical protein
MIKHRYNPDIELEYLMENIRNRIEPMSNGMKDRRNTIQTYSQCLNSDNYLDNGSVEQRSMINTRSELSNQQSTSMARNGRRFSNPANMFRKTN